MFESVSTDISSLRTRPICKLPRRGTSIVGFGRHSYTSKQLQVVDPKSDDSISVGKQSISFVIPITNVSDHSLSTCPPPVSQITPHIEKNRISLSEWREGRPSQNKAHPGSHLVRHAVKILTEIWPIELVPAVFHTSVNQPTRTPCFESPSSLGSPQISLPTHPTSLLNGLPSTQIIVVGHNHLSITNFVNDVLRRSRTTCSVLSSALCYVEAIRNQIPLIAGLMNTKTPTRGKSSIVIDEVEFCTQDVLQTPGSPPEDSSYPSPLLCPRRTFVAALVVATKFLQDHCISNKSWTKICDIPAREISRCERALCEALEWRLWVGKNYSRPRIVIAERSANTAILNGP